jgi:Asp/Glu/Hydantoin racemase/Allantoicase repeat
MRLLVLNPNTSESMTAEIAAAAASVAEGTEIVARNPRFGATAIDSAAESYLSAVGVMDLMATMLAANEFDYEAVILAGFGEHGKDALQEMLPVPVLDIAEAAAHVAHLIGRRGRDLPRLRRDGRCHRGDHSQTRGARRRRCGRRGGACPGIGRTRAEHQQGGRVRQVFVVEAADITALRVQAYPDGGIARVRAFGRPTERGVALLQSMWEASA